MKIIDFNNITSLVTRETLRVLRETLDSKLDDNNDERQRQKKMADVIKKQGLHASDNAGDVDEAEEEEEEVEIEDKETGVPAPEGEEGEEAASREDRTKGKGTPQSKKLQTPTDKQIKKVTVGNVIDKLNALRGGKSLKDPEVKSSFQQYFDSLTQKERESLLVFMTGIAQILAGVATGAEAMDPADVGLSVKGHVEKTEKTREEEKAMRKEKEQTASGRPGTPAAPIIVGESQNKQSILKALATYRRHK
tara:strand:+ start:664 stop:1413 length:750 start_codon:yes stop_codon:yes gene_type:complete